MNEKFPVCLINIHRIKMKNNTILLLLLWFSLPRKSRIKNRKNKNYTRRQRIEENEGIPRFQQEKGRESETTVRLLIGGANIDFHLTFVKVCEFFSLRIWSNLFVNIKMCLIYVWTEYWIVILLKGWIILDRLVPTTWMNLV